MDSTNGTADPTSSGSEIQNVDAGLKKVADGETRVDKNTKNPLEIDVVLRNLFSWLEAEELVPLRLVSSQWKRELTSLLRQSNFFLDFDYDQGKKMHVKSGCDSPEIMTLETFNSFLSTTKTENPDWKFPLVNFQFISGNLGSWESQEFFQIYGQNIKRLSLSLSNEGDETTPDTSLLTFRKILLEQANNLQELILYNVPVGWREDSALELFPEPRNTIQLPKLTKLVVHEDAFTHAKSHRLIQDLIQAAVNLKEIQGYKIQFLDPAASALENKIHAVKRIEFAPKNENEEQNLDLYAKFAEGRPKLVELTISLHDFNLRNPEWTRIVQLLQTILDSSKDSLESILKCPPLSHIPHLNLPPMKKVKDIRFTDHKRGVAFIWLENFDIDLDNADGFRPCPLKLREIFPNLQSVEIDFESYEIPVPENGLWLSYFDWSPSQSLDSVHDLKVKLELCPEFMEKLASIFPQVENLTIRPFASCFQQNMWTIWRSFSNVQNLELTIFKAEDILQNFRDFEVVTEQMDAGITGFSPETCIQLRNNSRNMKIEDAEALRTNPSILDAKKLKNFNIKFQREGDRFDFRRPIFSLVTGIFGFDAAKKKNGVSVFVEHEGGDEEELEEILAEAAYYLDFVTYNE